jgi:hypothetical protein
MVHIKQSCTLASPKRRLGQESRVSFREPEKPASIDSSDGKPMGEQNLESADERLRGIPIMPASRRKPLAYKG